MERTSSQNWFWPERPCSWNRAAQFSRFGRSKCGDLESCGGKKCTRAPSTFQFKLARTSSFRRARTEKWKAILITRIVYKWSKTIYTIVIFFVIKAIVCKLKVTVHLERCFKFPVCNSVNTHPIPTNLYINGKLMKLSKRW